MCKSPGASLMRPAINPALQSSPQVYDYPTNSSWPWLMITLHTVMTWPRVSTICFEIWNPSFVVSAMHDSVWFKADCFDAANRFYLTVCDVINYNDITSTTNSRVCKECAFYWYTMWTFFWSNTPILITDWTPLVRHCYVQNVAYEYNIVCMLIHFAPYLSLQVIYNSEHCTLNSNSWHSHHRSKAWSNDEGYLRAAQKIISMLDQCSYIKKVSVTQWNKLYSNLIMWWKHALPVHRNKRNVHKTTGQTGRAQNKQNYSHTDDDLRCTTLLWLTSFNIPVVHPSHVWKYLDKKSNCTLALWLCNLKSMDLIMRH